MVEKKKIVGKQKMDIKESKAVKNKHGKELKWILGIMAGIIVLLIIGSQVYTGVNNFKHEGLSFKKIRMGEINFYYYDYYFKDGEGQQYHYNMYLRNDPRANSVPVNGDIVLAGDAFTYVSINSTGLNECSDSNIALGSLTNFLSSNLLSVRAAKPDSVDANATNFRYVNCQTNPNDVVILFQQGANETRIDKTGNCHVVNVANCEIMKAVEKFEVQSILDAKARGQ